MSKVIPLLLLSPILFFNTVKASILAENARSQTSFTFTVNDIPLDVMEQGLTKRTVTEEQTTRTDGETSHHFVTYESYHLEIAYRLSQVDQRPYKSVEFYQGHERLLRLPLNSSQTLGADVPRRFEPNFIGINLKAVPLPLLDYVDRINFEK